MPMPFSFAFSDKLKGIIEKLRARDPKKAEIIEKKVRQIIDLDEFTIEHYKNLRYDLKHLKRVHIDRSFVLTFRYYREQKFILFLDFDHHDNIYGKR